MARSNTPASTPVSGDSARRAVEDSAAMASYIADMAAELAQLATRSELPMVAYFLNLARVEAESRARELGGQVIERARQ
jgi:hypothetical protein